MSANMRHLAGIFLLITLLLSACSSMQPTSTPASESAPLAPGATAAAEPAAAADTAPDTATDTATDTAGAGVETAASGAVDLKVAVDTFMSAIANDFLATGKLEDVQAAIAGGAYLIDVREPDEYAAGHLPGAVNIPLRTLAQNLDQVPSDQPVLVYCASSLRAGQATAVLHLLGYDNVKSFPGGFQAWSRAGQEVSTEATAAQTFAAKAVDAGVLAAADAFLSSLPAGFHSVEDGETLRQEIAAGAVLIDVREKAEYADGAIPGALNIPIRTVAKSLEQIPQDQPVIVYCASAHRAAMAGAMLHVLGYDNVRVFPGGYGAWETAQMEGGDVPTGAAAGFGANIEVLTAVDQFLSNIPDTFYSLGSLEAFKEAVESANPLLIDAREAEEYAAGHIAGAINIPLRTLADNLDKIPTDRQVIVYCTTGHRCGLAGAALAMLGYDNVRAFPGGWQVWSDAGEPIATEATAAAPVAPRTVAPAMQAAVSEFLATLPEGFLSVGDVAKLKAAIDAGVAVIDVREESELAEGQIAGAISIPLRTLAQNLDQIPTDRPVVVYCASGYRAAMAAAALRVMGMDNVYAFPAGYGVWQAAGEPTE